MLIVIGLATSISTLLGGLFALKFRDKLHLILGFSAGALIGVAFFDLLPEALELGADYFSTSQITSLIALGFLVYLVLDRLILLHSHHHDHDENCANPDHQPSKGSFAAGSLSFHSFLDGIAVGLAFQVSSAVGFVVTAAVLAHNFLDGINTVSLILKNGGDIKQAFRWLLLDSVAPFIGVLSTLFFTLPQSALALILALFAGFFFYIGASDLLPESHHGHPTRWTTFATILGLVVIYTAINLAGV